MDSARSKIIPILIVSGIFILASGVLLLQAHPLQTHDITENSREKTKELMKQMTSFDFPPGVAPEDLPEPDSQGVKLLQKYCTQCHEIFSPQMHSAEKWSSILQRVSWHMQQSIGKKMGRMAGMQAPTQQENEELLDYLKRYSLRAADQSRLNHLETPNGTAFQQTCAQCHALPAPEQYTAEQWPAVTARMRKNMDFMHKQPVQAEQETAILKFLQHLAAQ